jgi:hypothetical protein
MGKYLKLTTLIQFQSSQKFGKNMHKKPTLEMNQEATDCCCHAQGNAKK